MKAVNRASQILASALDATAVATNPDNTQPDLIVRTRDDRQIVLEFKWAGEGWPEDVRRAAQDVGDPWPANLVVLARELSPGAIEWLRERGANWADEAGQARILGPDGLLVIREPALARGRRRSGGAFVWSPSALSIAEAILARADEPLRAAAIAAVAGWSTPQTATVLKAFDARGWTTKRGPARGPQAYRELVDADAMLTAWSAAVGEQDRETRLAHRASEDLMALLRGKLKPALGEDLKWAVSGWAGLELAAPFATVTPALHVYVGAAYFAGPLSAAIEHAGLREVDEGGRVVFWRAEERIFDLASESHGVPVASAPRLYADLSSFGARGQDAADHVKAELIDPMHPAPASKRGDAKPESA